MSKYRFIRAVSLILVALLCFPPLYGFSVSDGSEEKNTLPQDVYDNYGIEPMLPIEGELDIASIDYYYELKNDTLPGLHGGIDFICARNTPILAVCDGVVMQTQTGYSGGYGNNIILEHTNKDGSKYYSRYAHLNYIKVSMGEQVAKGQTIGLAGSTGQSSAYHLHLEIYTSEHPDRYELLYDQISALAPRERACPHELLLPADKRRIQRKAPCQDPGIGTLLLRQMRTRGQA